MDNQTPEDVSNDDRAVQTAMRFLAALFEPHDEVLFRPIETWVERGQKQSRVINGKTLYRKSVPAIVPFTIKRLARVAGAEKANIFFGVCPRVGGVGRFDLAWQIRTVRTLWADIDQISVEDAIAEVTATGLPPPSIVVNSGNGAHLYWLLDKPYLIDDADPPLPVLTDWLQGANGRKRPRKYVLQGDERIFLEGRHHLSRLSDKAQLMQHALAGIALVIGGDHTTDLSRLLRLPGTLNRKDERNGKPPVPATLVQCESSRRYRFEDFEAFAAKAPDRERARRIAVMPLPMTRRASASSSDKLADLIAASAVAAPGTRSEADFAACCFAVRKGIGKDDVWAQAQHVGKFAEAGAGYFDRTWENAEFEVRAGKLAALEEKHNAAPSSAATVAAKEREKGNGVEDILDRPVIRVDPANMPVGLLMRDITEHLLAAKNCYLRADQLVVIRDESIRPVLKAAELAGLLNDLVEFYFSKDEDGEFKPLPVNYGNTWFHQPGERARLPSIRLYSHNPIYAEDWRLVDTGYDRDTGFYLAGPRVEPRPDTASLDVLLKDFCFKTPADRSNYIGVLLTLLLMPRFIGSKPAALFNGNQPGLGKTILAQIIAILRDGRQAETATYNPNDEEFEKRLGSLVKSGATTIIVDNAKLRGRRRMESPCLERSLTDAVLSFRLLGYSESIRTENSHIFCITANTPDVGRDLVIRSVVINLEHEGNPTRRTFSIQDPEAYALEHRAELLGELVGMVERWKAAGVPRANLPSRFNKRGWANIIGGILAACGEPDFLANTEEAATQLDESRREFGDLVAIMADHPQGVWSAAELTDLAIKHELLAAERGDGSSRSQTTRMGILASRFVAEPFPLADGRQAVFHKSTDRKGAVYQVEIPPTGAER